MSQDGRSLVPEARRAQWLRGEIQRREALAETIQAQISELRNELFILEVAQVDAEKEIDPAAAVASMAASGMPPLNCSVDSMATDDQTAATADGDAEVDEDAARAAWNEVCARYNLKDGDGHYLTPRNNQLRAFAAAMTGQNVLNVDAPGNGKTLSYIVNALCRMDPPSSPLRNLLCKCLCRLHSSPVLKSVTALLCTGGKMPQKNELQRRPRWQKRCCQQQKQDAPASP